MLPLPEFDTLDAIGLAELVARGEVAPAELVEATIARVEHHDARLNAIVHRMFDEGLAAARGALPDGPFKGVPYLLKDLHATAAGHPTSDGCRLAQGQVAQRDSTLVARLRAAGLVILGKTNVPELGIMGITEPRLHGPTRNPWDPDRTPGGSSGGSAAAVAARYVPAAHASDGGGSIRIPASHCGLVGLKPTRARTPSGPEHGPGWGGLAIEHALTRTVRDTAALLDATLDPEPGAPYQVASPERPYLQAIDRPPGALRIGFCTRALLAGQADPAAVLAVQRAATLCEQLGHQVVESEPGFDAAELRRAYFAFVASGVAADVHALAARAGRPPRPSDVEPTTWVLKQVGEALRGVDLEQARRSAHALGYQLGQYFQTVDVWITATCARPPARVGELYPDASKERLMALLRVIGTRSLLLSSLDRLAADALSATPNTQLANLAGTPAISLPLHADPGGLPVGVQFMAAFGREDLLLQLAAQIEQASPWIDRRPPILENA